MGTIVIEKITGTFKQGCQSRAIGIHYEYPVYTCTLHITLTVTNKYTLHNSTLFNSFYTTLLFLFEKRRKQRKDNKIDMKLVEKK